MKVKHIIIVLSYLLTAPNIWEITNTPSQQMMLPPIDLIIVIQWFYGICIAAFIGGMWAFKNANKIRLLTTIDNFLEYDVKLKK